MSFELSSCWLVISIDFSLKVELLSRGFILNFEGDLIDGLFFVKL
jgi:hypothetical protein